MKPARTNDYKHEEQSLIITLCTNVFFFFFLFILDANLWSAYEKSSIFVEDYKLPKEWYLYH
jgi:hypothetical protein